MGLPDAPSQPKIVIIRPPSAEAATSEDLVLQGFSMGVPHKAIPMTVGLCVGVAANLKGTVAQRAVVQTRARAKRDTISAGDVVLRHPGGTVDVKTEFDSNNELLSVSVARTGRWLMQGVVWW